MTTYPCTHGYRGCAFVGYFLIYNFTPVLKADLKKGCSHIRLRPYAQIQT